MGRFYRRRIIAVLVILSACIGVIVAQPEVYTPTSSDSSGVLANEARATLETLAVKGRAPKTGYARTQFGDGWRRAGVCDMRNVILHRDLQDATVGENCRVLRGILEDPYTGNRIVFERGPTSSQSVQIDHVVALSNAWQTGAQQLTHLQREDLANDPLNLLAVDGLANQKKSDSDAATWLPANKAFRCQYVDRQVTVKKKYRLWVTPAEKQAMQRVLAQCG